jgi:hypothetical protein
VWNISGLELTRKYRNTQRNPAHCHLVHCIFRKDWFRIEPEHSGWDPDHWLRLSLFQLSQSALKISHDQLAASDRRENSTIQLNSITWHSEITTTKRSIFSDITLLMWLLTNLKLHLNNICHMSQNVLNFQGRKPKQTRLLHAYTCLP